MVVDLLTFPLLDCSEFINFVITLISRHLSKDWGIGRFVITILSFNSSPYKSGSHDIPKTSLKDLEMQDDS